MFDSRDRKRDNGAQLPESDTHPLSHLKRGQAGVIVDLNGADQAPVQRLMEMGFIPGAHVSVFNAGDPMLIELNGNRIGMGKALLRDIVVMLLD